MQRSEVEMVFEKEKGFLIKECLTSSNPLAILLGGQPAAEKSNPAIKAKEEHQNETFLIINGDEYRIYHPEHDSLIKKGSIYSEETQIFSSVFTEKLIEEVIKTVSA